MQIWQFLGFREGGQTPVGIHHGVKLPAGNGCGPSCPPNEIE